MKVGFSLAVTDLFLDPPPPCRYSRWRRWCLTCRKWAAPSLRTSSWRTRRRKACGWCPLATTARSACVDSPVPLLRPERVSSSHNPLLFPRRWTSTTSPRSSVSAAATCASQTRRPCWRNSRWEVVKSLFLSADTDNDLLLRVNTDQITDHFFILF